MPRLIRLDKDNDNFIRLPLFFKFHDDQERLRALISQRVFKMRVLASCVRRDNVT